MPETHLFNSHLDSASTFPAALKIWEIYLQDQNKSIYTIKAFLGDLGLLMEFLPPDVSIGDISIDDLNRFIKWLENGRGRNISCSAKSLSRRITTLKSFFRWLSDNGRISRDPAVELIQHTVISPLPEVLTQVEEEKVISTALKTTKAAQPDSRPYVLLKLLLETGIKKSECLNLKRNHIFSENGERYLFVRYPDQKDRNKERKIGISPDWLEQYESFLIEYDPRDAVFPWSPRRLEYLLEEIGEKAGLVKHLSFSMCRWNCALTDLRNGVNQDIIRQKLGVSKIQWREISMKLKKLHQMLNSE
jgi:site-specific recombinase XerD